MAPCCTCITPAFKGRKAGVGQRLRLGLNPVHYFGMGKLPRKASPCTSTDPPTSGEGDTVNGVNSQMY